MSPSRKASQSSRLPHTPRSIAPSPISVPSTASNTNTTGQKQAHPQNSGPTTSSLSLAGSSSSTRHPSNSMRPPTRTASSQSYGLSVSSTSPTPSTPSLLTRTPSAAAAAAALGYNMMPSPSPTTLFAPHPYTQYPEFLAPSPTPTHQPPTSRTSLSQTHTQQDHQAYAHFCRQIQETFRNMARGLLGAHPGIQTHPNHPHTPQITTPIKTTQTHRHLAAKTSTAISTFIQSLPLPPTPPHHDRQSQEDIILNTQSLWVVSFPHHFSAQGEMRSGMTDYFRGADRNLRILCGHGEWGVLARRCRRRFAGFLEGLEGFGFECVFLEGGEERGRG